MNAVVLVFVVVSVVALIGLPRRWAPVPLLAATCYMTLGQGIELGPFTFTVFRILVAAGAVRVVVRREGLPNGLNMLDSLLVLWSVWACLSSVFHASPASALVYRLGLAYNACGVYFLLRILCPSIDDVVRLVQMTAILLTVVALAMLYEHASLHNLFSVFGGVSNTPEIREGRVRAAGPFAHAILAGTAGAVNLPLMIGTWTYGRGRAMLGIAACLAMVFSSASSSPLLSTLFASGALALWRYRHRISMFRWVAAFVLVVLDLVMKAPVYYLIARIDLVGGSTGWHRARLIESAFEHLSEWWFAGTDYTAHWMGEVMMFDPTQVDITNHYLRLGVVGGLPLMLLLVAVLATAFSFVGKAQHEDAHVAPAHRFMIWCLGCALFAHAATFISVSYFDQSVVFLYLNLAIISTARSQPCPARVAYVRRLDPVPHGFAAIRTSAEPSASHASQSPPAILTSNKGEARSVATNRHNG